MFAMNSQIRFTYQVGESSAASLTHIEVDGQLFIPQGSRSTAAPDSMPFGQAPTGVELQKGVLPDSQPPVIPRHGKAPRTDVAVLVREGYLTNGQSVHLRDYKGNRVPNCSATISGRGLNFNGEHFSLSALAQRLLAETFEFKSGFVQGPARWFTDSEQSILDFWNQYLERLQTPLVK